MYLNKKQHIVHIQRGSLGPCREISVYREHFQKRLDTVALTVQSGVVPGVVNYLYRDDAFSSQDRDLMSLIGTIEGTHFQTSLQIFADTTCVLALTGIIKLVPLGTQRTTWLLTL